MQIKDRQQLLLVIVVALLILLVGDKVVRAPLWNLWVNRSQQVAKLRDQIKEGKALQRRADVIRTRWDKMRREALPKDNSLAEQKLFAAIDGWTQNSGATVNAITPQWKPGGDEYLTLDCQLEVAGDIGTLSRFLYEVEREPLALRLNSVELTSRDKEGQQLAMNLQLSGLVLNPKTK
ncbi:MAG TPA: type 4a pilus biogenesis protein PilO [Dongiaceae bacterium]|nr:type 4a pilus biogenesis protein PilO [Dongiaceae bacterium]